MEPSPYEPEHRARFHARTAALRPSARTGDAVHHRDVGALHLLRHARDPDPVHDRAPIADGGLGLDDKTASAIYGLYISATYLLSLLGGWIADRLIGQQRAVFWGGVLIMLGNGCARRRQHAAVLHRPDRDRARRRPAQAEHQRHRRAALSGRRLASRRRLLDLLHGHQPRRVPRLDRSCRSPPRRSAGARASRCRRSACCSAWCSSRSPSTTSAPPASCRSASRRRWWPIIGFMIVVVVVAALALHRHARSSTRCASRSSRTGR